MNMTPLLGGGGGQSVVGTEPVRGSTTPRLIKEGNPASVRPPEANRCARRFGLQVAVILAGFSPNCMQEILEVSLRAWQDAFSLGKIAKAQFQQLA